MMQLSSFHCGEQSHSYDPQNTRSARDPDEALDHKEQAKKKQHTCLHIYSDGSILDTA